MTGKIGTFQQSVDQDKFGDNFDRIFGKKKVKASKSSYVQDPETGKLVPRDEYIRPDTVNAPMVHGDFKAVKSPITGEEITCRGKLRKHQKQHDIVDSRDYSPEYMKKKENARRTSVQKEMDQSLRNDIGNTIDQLRGR